VLCADGGVFKSGRAQSYTLHLRVAYAEATRYRMSYGKHTTSLNAGGGWWSTELKIGAVLKTDLLCC
jgi:hypothetical protein